MSCTGILESLEAGEDAANAQGTWFSLEKIVVNLDNGLHTRLPYAVGIDFIGQSRLRVSVELSPDTAKRLAEALRAALDKGVKAGVVERL